MLGCLRQMKVCKRWRLSCTASGPQLHGSLGSTGLRPMPPHCSRDLEHGIFDCLTQTVEDPCDLRLFVSKRMLLFKDF